MMHSRNVPPTTVSAQKTAVPSITERLQELLKVLQQHEIEGSLGGVPRKPLESEKVQAALKGLTDLVRPNFDCISFLVQVFAAHGAMVPNLVFPEWENSNANVLAAHSDLRAKALRISADPQLLKWGQRFAQGFDEEFKLRLSSPADARTFCNQLHERLELDPSARAVVIGTRIKNDHKAKGSPDWIIRHGMLVLGNCSQIKNSWAVHRLGILGKIDMSSVNHVVEAFTMGILAPNSSVQEVKLVCRKLRS